MKLLFLILVLCCAFMSPVFAINKCTQADGRIIYSDLPCTGVKAATVKVDVPDRPSIIYGMAESDRQRMLKIFRAAKTWNDGIDANQVQVGMPSTLARLIEGSPSDINRTQTRNGTREQWVYRSGYSTKYIYVEQGQVTAIQD